MKSLAPNTLLQNRYLIVHLIGKGGMGDVYLAVDQRLGSAVALKRTFFADDETLGNAFEREAKTLARLRHPVLPKVSDHFVENGEQFLVMEHISGDDLAKRLETSQKPFPLSWVLFWADQLLDALAYLHAHEPPIIHRDIKPQNLKLTDENSVILLDFGLSKNNAGETKRVVSSGSTGSTGSVVGYTPHYAPMEQIRGTGTSPRSDVYALSATVYQLMTNVIPSDALTRADALLNGMEDPIRPLNEINPEIPPAVSAVILKGMEISQDRRFQSAREMQKTLREAFAQIQNQMTAQTVAFNLQNDSSAAEAVQSPPVILKTPEDSSFSAANPVPIAAQSPDAAPNFEATLRMDSQAPGATPKKPEAIDSVPKQSAVKTEVFPGNSLPIVPPAPLDFDFGGEKPSSVGMNSQGSAKNESGDYADFSDANRGRQSYRHDESAFPNSSASPNADDDDFSTPMPTRSFTAADFSREVDESSAVSRADRFSTPQTAPVIKKSSNKSVAIFGGLFAFFVLAAIAAGSGWYFYQTRNAATVVEETPTPMPVFEASPSPAPTIETVYESNVNSSATTNVNSETVSSDSNAASEANNQEANKQSDQAVEETADNAADNAAKQTTAANSVKPKTPPSTAPRGSASQERAGQPKGNPAPPTKPSAKPPAKKPSAPIILQ